MRRYLRGREGRGIRREGSLELGASDPYPGHPCAGHSCAGYSCAGYSCAGQLYAGLMAAEYMLPSWLYAANMRLRFEAGCMRFFAAGWWWFEPETNVPNRRSHPPDLAHGASQSAAPETLTCLIHRVLLSLVGSC